MEDGLLIVILVSLTKISMEADILITKLFMMSKSDL